MGMAPYYGMVPYCFCIAYFCIIMKFWVIIKVGTPKFQLRKLLAIEFEGSGDEEIKFNIQYFRYLVQNFKLRFFKKIKLFFNKK